MTSRPNLTYGVGISYLIHMVSNSANHMTNYKENVMQVTCAPAKPAPLEGTLVIDMWVVNPVNHISDKHKFKRLTLARHHCLSYEEAEAVLDKFKELNHMSIKPEYINAQWTHRRFL